jgi:2-polyprenyl-6-hydroxyphenyl methylase/3-demethylubiquinone-9 3-methyltransferase
MISKTYRRLFSTVDPKEMATFSKYNWWNKDDTLHKLTELRVEYLIKAFSLQHPNPFKGMKIIDIGCGGGIFSERLARLGGEVTGIDPNENAIKAAKFHQENYAKNIPGKLEYRNAEVSQVSDMFDLVIASEVIEHVTDPKLFLSQVVARIKPAGWTFITAPNRTLWSWLTICQVAELSGILERGTHEWNKFVTPEEVTQMLHAEGLTVKEKVGTKYNLISRKFEFDKDDSFNYFILAHKNN